MLLIGRNRSLIAREDNGLGGRRYTYLDLVRGLAAFSVIVVHYRWFYAAYPGDWTRSFSHPLPGAALLQPIYDHGGFAVQLFWLLSGIVFTIKYGDGRPFDGRRFWVWRFARLYPLHLATLLLVTGIQLVSLRVSGSTTVYANLDPYHFALQLVMASAWGFEAGDSFNGPIWSASVEILIYAAFFLYARWARPRLVLQIAVAALFFLAWFVTRSRVASCGSLFFLGGVLPLAFAAARGFDERLARRLALTVFPLVFAAALCATQVFSIYLPDIVHFYVVLPALLATTLALDTTLPPLPRSLRWIGDITYSTYLLHMPILIAAKIWLDTRSDRLAILASPWTLLVYFASVVLCGMVVYRGFERPVQRAIQRRYDPRIVTTAIDREVEQTV